MSESVSSSSSASAKRQWLVFLIVAFLSIGADQATKVWARHALPTSPATCDVPADMAARLCYGTKVEVIGNVWDWRLSMNPGSAFGMFSGKDSARVFLSIIGVLAVFGMLWMLKKSRPDQRALHWALGLVAGGAVGNLIDRISFGVVTDFVLWHWKATEWPVFNIADVVLVVGVGLMFVDIRREAKLEKAARATTA